MSQAWVGAARSSAGMARGTQLRRAKLYLVTDDETPAADLPHLVARAVAGGVDIVQLRRKQAAVEDLVSVGSRCLESAHEGGALFLVDDHVDLALEIGADGVHLGQSDLAPVEARARLGGDRLLGLSTHSRQQLLGAGSQPIDYVSAGPVYATPTKPGRPAVGLEHVTLAASRSALPVVAIGGLGPDTVGSAVAAGADIVAVVRAICRADDPQRAAIELRGAIEAAPVWFRLRVNGQDRKCPPACSVSGFLELLQVSRDGVVVECNGTILRAPDLGATQLREGDDLELVHLVGGGIADE